MSLSLLVEAADSFLPTLATERPRNLTLGARSSTHLPVMVRRIAFGVVTRRG
jgi:hypothetical protein